MCHISLFYFLLTGFLIHDIYQKVLGRWSVNLSNKFPLDKFLSIILINVLSIKIVLLPGTIIVGSVMQDWRKI